MTNSTYWLIASVVLLALEAFGIPGIGFLFAGIAALVTAGIIALGLVGEQAILAQWALFFTLTGLSAVLMWKRLKSWRMRPEVPEYSNIVGTDAVAEGLMITKDEGTVRWSGTLMQARLADATAPAIAHGTPVIVTRVEGNTLFVTVKL